MKRKKMAPRIIYPIIAIMMMLMITVAVCDDWTSQCNKCSCRWVNGKKVANCAGIGLFEIPTDLSSEIREIDFSNNSLYELGQEVVARAELKDVHKLKFQNCSLSSIHQTAFKGLRLLIELDLTKNTISVLNKQTFRDNLKLRVLTLSFNKLRKIEQGLFYNLTHLQKIYLNNNEIELIEDNVFTLLPSLQHINLGYNRLKTITSDFTEGLPKLNSLNLEGNPWVCDCNLEEFRQKTIKYNLITAPTECAAPARLKGQLWTTESVIFACLPEIVQPQASTQIEATTNNVTLTCGVRGYPQPDVDWVTNGRIIDKDPRQNTQRFFTSKQRVGDFTWNNLTIIDVNYRDKGEYKCVAKNPGGVDEKNISLIVSVAVGGGGGTLPLGSTLPLIIGLVIGIVVILLIVLILICCCCRRTTHGISGKRGDLMQASDECMHLHGPPEMEKALITDVNPVMKPPRVCSVPPSVNSGGTEVSEVKKNLLDNDSVFAGDDESRSLDFEMQPFRRSQNLLDSEYRGNHPYPPDLLPFPPRMCQVSPAGSSASTVADTSRLPSHHGPQSPLHSPLYDQMALYRTLPYSRSQSPFVGPPAPRIPRQGYVTIPRRPRQSWSSEPPSSTTTTNEIVEPLYDNLGLRTTADGSSALSLNKIGGGEASTPKSIRMFPLSPTSCDPIAEHESLSTAATATTLPRNLENLRLSPSRTEWARANAEAFKSPDQRRNSLPSSDKKASTKIAPVPPPKPKKRTSTGPLFEDEGEDGTEV